MTPHIAATGTDNVSATATYIGLDLSLRATGLCMIRSNSFKAPVSCVISPANLRAAPRLAAIKAQLHTILDTMNIIGEAIVGLEGYSYGSKGRTFEIGELGGVVKEFLYNSGFFTIVVPPTVVKEFLTGNGRADKIEMMKVCKEQSGIEFGTDHECDAYVLANIAAAFNEDRCAFDLTTRRKELIKSSCGL